MLGSKSPYTISDIFGEMTKDQVNHDVERFFESYLHDNNITGIKRSELNKVFLLYITRYLIHKDVFFDERMN